MQSERIATLLTRQFHELNHCQKILSHGGPMLSESLRFSTEIKQAVATLAMSLEKVQPQKSDDTVVTVGQNKGREVQVTCWKISST
jgi:hypothetical protein